MPLAAHRDLPAFELLRREGVRVLDGADPLPRLNIGLLNLMPDAVLTATERQWMRLCSGFDGAVSYVYPCSPDAHERSAAAQAHIARYYDTLATVRERDLDLLIVTGANPRSADITHETFWQPMLDLVAWARRCACPVVCSCLATHAVVKALYGIDRRRLPEKCWGVYAHTLLEPKHPLVQNIDTGWHVPHSHLYGVTRRQLEDAGLCVLAEGVEAGVYVAVSRTPLEFLFLQGHPEYDANSLLKEFKREVRRFNDGLIPEFPRVPAHCFGADALETVAALRVASVDAKTNGGSVPCFPEALLEGGVRNVWRTSGGQLFDNLLRLIHEAKRSR